LVDDWLFWSCRLDPIKDLWQIVIRQLVRQAPQHARHAAVGTEQRLDQLDYLIRAIGIAVKGLKNGCT
jgi:hypothetical protein